MHPSSPLMEELENVPRGHGNNVTTRQLLSSILLNPEAKRAAIRSLKKATMRMASVRELIAFLEDKKFTLKG